MSEELKSPLDELREHGFVDLVIKLPGVEKARLWRIWAKQAYQIFSGVVATATNPEAVVHITGAVSPTHIKSIDVQMIDVRALADGGEGEVIASWQRSPTSVDDLYRVVIMELASNALRELWEASAPWDDPFAVPAVQNP